MRRWTAGGCAATVNSCIRFARVFRCCWWTGRFRWQAESWQPSHRRFCGWSLALPSIAFPWFCFMPKRFDSIESVVADIRKGRMVIVVDDADRENEGDLIMAAQHVTPEAVNFMAKHGRGLICVPTTSERLQQLGIERMVRQNRETFKTDFQVSVDAAKGVTTGISAGDRAHTIKIMAEPTAIPEDLVQPGHVFPLRARPGGVLQRAGHTEAAVDLVKLAGQ